MSSLSTTAAEILELCGRPASHPDPATARAILLTDIENKLHDANRNAQDELYRLRNRRY